LAPPGADEGLKEGQLGTVPSFSFSQIK